MIPVFFLILQSIKYCEKRQYHRVKRHRSYSSFSIRGFSISVTPIYHDGVFRWWKYLREKFFSYKWPSAHLTIKSLFGTLKASFRCLQRAVDININTFPKFLYLFLTLHNYFELQKEKIPENSLALSFEKRVQPATSNLLFTRFLNENAKDIR